MVGKADGGGWQEIMRDHMFYVPGKYIFWLFFFYYQRGLHPSEACFFQADFFLAPFKLEQCIIT